MDGEGMEGEEGEVRGKMGLCSAKLGLEEL